MATIKVKENGHCWKWSNFVSSIKTKYLLVDVSVPCTFVFFSAQCFVSDAHNSYPMKSPHQIGVAIFFSVALDEYAPAGCNNTNIFATDVDPTYFSHAKVKRENSIRVSNCSQIYISVVCWWLFYFYVWTETKWPALVLPTEWCLGHAFVHTKTNFHSERSWKQSQSVCLSHMPAVRKGYWQINWLLPHWKNHAHHTINAQLFFTFLLKAAAYFFAVQQLLYWPDNCYK